MTHSVTRFPVVILRNERMNIHWNVRVNYATSTFLRREIGRSCRHKVIVFKRNFDENGENSACRNKFS